jgi:tRNA/tmRNA/rRNA uracil-C5-methylase (TrmA/RlmC/RlmD family)
MPAAMGTPGAPIEVTIERILPGGVGLAHAEGRTLFVALAAPGDIVRVRIDQIRGQLGFASIEEIVTPSPVRVEPPCPYFGRCGGCDFQQLSYAAQLDAKIEIIRDCLHRIARLENLPEIAITPSPQQWHYRARANWQYDSRTNALGYFERGSHRVCDVAECAVLVPELAQTLQDLRQHARDRSLSEDLREIDALAGDEGVSVAPPLTDSPTRNVSRRIGAESYELDAAAFFQTNHFLLAPLIDEAVRDARGETAVDLYCGVGLFTVPLARRFANVVGIEANATASKFARRNLRSAQLANAQVVTARAGEWLKTHALSSGSVDFLLLDPPRSGVESGAIEDILALKPRRIAYVSCDPATLARDLKTLVAGGYSLDSIAAFDMFPQTHHVETVVHVSGPKS